MFIPYCTGDLHAGQAKTYIDYAGEQNFAGYNNATLAFKYIVQALVPHLKSNAEVMLAGLSAGGFGALINAPKLHGLLPSHIPMTVLDDSAPPFTSDLLQECQQERWYNTWGFANTFDKDACDSCTPRNWLNPFFQEFLKNKPYVGFSLASNTDDQLLQSFSWLFTDLANCRYDPSAPAYRRGLEKIRQQMKDLRALQENTGTYYVLGSPDHCFIGDNRYFSTNIYDSAWRRWPLRNWVESQFDRSVPGTPAPRRYSHLAGIRGF